MLPNSPLPTSPNGMLARTISSSSPFSSIVVRALWAKAGLHGIVELDVGQLGPYVGRTIYPAVRYSFSFAIKPPRG